MFALRILRTNRLRCCGSLKFEYLWRKFAGQNISRRNFRWRTACGNDNHSGRKHRRNAFNLYRTRPKFTNPVALYVKYVTCVKVSGNSLRPTYTRYPRSSADRLCFANRKHLCIPRFFSRSARQLNNVSLRVVGVSYVRHGRCLKNFSRPQTAC